MERRWRGGLGGEDGRTGKVFLRINRADSTPGVKDANPIPVAAEREPGLELLGFVVEFALLRQGAADVFHQVALLGTFLHEGGFGRWEGGRWRWGGG